jgi:hypothetical protein
MMKSRSLHLTYGLVSALVGAYLLCATAVPSRAATLEPFQPNVIIGLGITSLHDGSVPAGPFTDDFFFGVNTAFNLTANAVITNAANVIDPFSIAVWAVGGVAPLFSSSFINVIANTETVATSGFLLSPGNYFVRVAGISSIATAVDGNINLAAVPLPAAIPMFASGLLGMWALTRRRKRQRAGLPDAAIA